MTTPARKLLTDEQLREFLTNGFIALKADQPREFHQNIFKQFTNVLETRHGNPGNNVMPHVPGLQQLFDCPTISGALTSVLGERYMMHPHRHMHANSNPQGGGWHKDSYWGYTRRIRNHRPWWVMIMYYPQDTPFELGPTGVVAGSHNHATRIEPEKKRGETQVTGEAGTFFMIQYDIWHRATENTLGQQRFMLKFEFTRMDAPTPKAPWNNQESEWRAAANVEVPYPHHGMQRQVWNWLKGQPRPNQNSRPVSGSISTQIERLKSADPYERMHAGNELDKLGSPAAEAVPVLAELLSDTFEPASINAAYALSSIGAPAVPALKKALLAANGRGSLNAAYAFSNMGPEAVPALLEASAHENPIVRAQALFALGEIPHTNGDVLSVLAKATTDADIKVRIQAVEGLGMKGAAASKAVPVLCDALLKDADNEVRFDASLALARIGAAAAVPALEKSLTDSCRYVRGYGVEALHHIGTPAAYKVLIPHLKALRWCETTTPASTF